MEQMNYFTPGPSDVTPDLSRYHQARGADANIFFARQPQPSDLADIIECTKDAINGVDYLPAYFLRYLQQPNRRSVVVVHKPTNKVVYFASELFVDDNKTAVNSSGRARKDMRKLGLTVTAMDWLNRISRPAFPDCNLLLGVTRHDIMVLSPRFLGDLQTNLLLGTNYVLNLASDLRDVEKLVNNIDDFGNVSYREIPYAETSRVLSQSAQVKQLLLGGEFLIIDSFPYKLSCDSNFRRHPDLFDTVVCVSSQTRDISKLDATAPQADLSSAIDGVSFVNTNLAQAGLHFKFYAYTSSVEILLAQLRHCLSREADRLRELRRSCGAGSGDVLSFVEQPDRVQFTIVFPLALNPQEARKRLLEIGFEAGVTGTDIQRQYLMKDEVTAAHWKSKL